MFQLVYISTAARTLVDRDVADILATSQRNNRAADVTGVLLQRDRRFLQVLEGSEAAVMATVARIERDPRHIAIVLLSHRMVADRAFGGWAMASDRDGPRDTILARVAALAEQAHPNLRAELTSFAAMTAPTARFSPPPPSPPARDRASPAAC